MSRARFAAVAAAAAVLIPTSLAFAPAAFAGPSAQDQMFMAGSAQTNLAEISLGAIVTGKSANQQALALATKTVADHKDAQAKLTALAATLKVSLPTAPNADQQAAAAKVQAAAAGTIDATYAQVQIDGHQKALAATDTELSAGTDAGVKAYAQATRPVVAMHLQMAQDLLAATGGTPAGVPAGTGGQAAPRTASTSWLSVAGWVSAGLLIVAAAALLTRSRRSVRRG